MIRSKISSGKKTLKQRTRKAALQMLVACGFLMGMQSCSKDLLTGQPSWLGNSIYERLQEGIDVTDGSHKTFDYTLRLIDDLDYKDVLAQTGSKTLFVTPDEDYDAWFKNNTWGVSSYDDLTTAQKKQLFKGTMVNNAYLLELMSNVPAGDGTNDTPEEGMCMRRETAVSIYDNIPIWKKEKFPHNSIMEVQHITDPDNNPDDPANIAWANVTKQGKDIHIFKDATAAPMIHFLPAFMKKNNITNHDLEIISNGESNSIEDSWINGKKVISDGQTCKNGYIYVISGVMESNPSMAEIINDTTKAYSTKIFARLLNRFSVPVAMSKSIQQEFWRMNKDCEANNDSVYQLRYLNESGNHSLFSTVGDDNNAESLISDVLKYDPGWNQYKADNNNIIMQNDAAAMLVPTDDKLNAWLESGGGQALYEKFGKSQGLTVEQTWDAIPSSTIVPLLNVNMLSSFVAYVPSKFDAIQDDAQRTMGVTESQIEHCYMGCNGVVYITNQVFQPSKFSSVIYPTTVQSTGSFSVMSHALSSKYTSSYVTTNGSAKDFEPYLSAMDSRFSLVVPYNVHNSVGSQVTGVGTKVFGYIDPLSYGLTTQYYLEFYYSDGKVNGYAYPCVLTDQGTVQFTSGTIYQLSTDAIANRLYDLIDNSIIISDITSDQQYYLTKAGSVMRSFSSNNNQYFQGGYQLNYGQAVEVTPEHQYNMGKEGVGNGTTYGVAGNTAYTTEDGATMIVDVPMTSPMSVYEVLKKEYENKGDSLFYKLLFDDESSTGLFTSKDGSYYCCNPSVNKNINLFDNFNYTVYVPTDNAIQTLIDNGYLPTWEDYNNATSETDKTNIATIIHNFVRYHIQDNSVFIGGEKLSGTQYESSKLNPTNNRFYSLTVTQDGNSLTVKDYLGNERHVVKDGGFYNKACREYWMKLGSGVSSVEKLNTVGTSKCTIESSSNAVVHKIDGALFYDKSQTQQQWRYSSAKRK